MVRVHLSRPVQVQGKGDRGDQDFRSLLYGGRFISYPECVGEARERRIGSRGDASSSSIGFPSFAVSVEGDRGEAPSMFYPQPPSVIWFLNPLFLFTSTLRATTSSLRKNASALARLATTSYSTLFEAC